MAIARERGRALMRVALGCAQMFAAALAVVLLVRTGVSPVALVAVVFACVLSTASVLFFGRGSR